MAVKVGKYRLFQRRQDTGTFWYYWFYNEAGKRVQFSCGHGCESKREAKAFLEELARADLLKDNKKEELRQITFSHFAKDMFLEGSLHLKRWEEKAIS